MVCVHVCGPRQNGDDFCLLATCISQSRLVASITPPTKIWRTLRLRTGYWARAKRARLVESHPQPHVHPAVALRAQQRWTRHTLGRSTMEPSSARKIDLAKHKLG